MFNQYDVIVVGAGHAGCEAAVAAAKLGAKTLLITMNMMNMGQMSCNPAMGGVAKGQIVRELDAIGGLSGIVSDLSAIQFRMLNQSKGPAMYSPRTQNDRYLFSYYWRIELEKLHNLHIYQDLVTNITTQNQKITGVVTRLGHNIKANAVVLTNGTFLNGLIHIGEKNFSGGRTGEAASFGITEQLNQLGFKSGRMKTGTPPRIDSRSLDYSKFEEQKGDENPSKFSYSPRTKPLQKQLSCHIVHTNLNVHDVLREGFEQSPMFTGRIQGLGPRYCPSIEDKINRFADKERHQLFIEPEGWETIEIYLNGFSSSLPEEVQYKALKQIPGFENVRMFRPGYAIEYDFFQPTQLYPTLETKIIENLYFAGQINGTTGYEEAAAQGFMAAANAVLKLKGEEPFILQRHQAYIGVLIDDLVNKGTEEPYRMFTSRAEFRLLLRQDNADLRLTPLAHKFGLITDSELERVEKKQAQLDKVNDTLLNTKAAPNLVNPILEQFNSPALREKGPLINIVKRPGVGLTALAKTYQPLIDQLSDVDDDILEIAEVEIKYADYIHKESEQVKKVEQLENLKIPQNFDYRKISSLSIEAREKLTKIRPTTIGQASRISGVSPSDISVLMVFMGR